MTNEVKNSRDYTYEPAITEIEGLGQGGALKNYMRLAIGSGSLLDLLKYELITGICAQFPGGFGYFLRQKLYRYLFRRMGRGITIGRNVTIRGPKRIEFGDNVFIEDNCSIDAWPKGSNIVFGNNVMVARDTIIRSRGGEIVIKDGVSIGSKCIIATDSKLEIGKDVLIAAFCYLSGGGSHNYSRTDIPIRKQGITSKGGIIIGDGAWIGANAIVMDGSIVGDGAIIGVKSVVNKKLPAMSISLGIPAKVAIMRQNEMPSESAEKATLGDEMSGDIV